MKKDYDLGNLKKRSGKLKTSMEAAKTPISIRLEAVILAGIKTEALRMGVPYQTLIGSILHRYATGELIDRSALDLKKLLKDIS